jgi:hypothetical protein
MSSSHPKIVIAPKKKKTKVVISSLKRPPTTAGISGSSNPPSSLASSAGAGGAGGGGGAAPPSPTTVLPPHESQESHTSSSTNNNKAAAAPIKKSMKSRPTMTGSVLIKAYAKPPALPVDFYDTSLIALRDALSTVLVRNFEAKCGSSGTNIIITQHPKSLLQEDVCMEDATTTTTALQQKRPQYSKLGREELYRSVEDLRVHGHGTRLYLDVAALMDHAASETVRRLCAHCGGNDDDDDDNANEINAIIDPNTGHVGYDITQILCTTTTTTTTANNTVFDHQSVGGHPNSSSSTTLDSSNDDDVRRTNLLRRMRNVLRSSYVEGYLIFVRSIFLALDGAYVYHSDISLEDITGCILSSSKSSLQSSLGGRVLDRSSVGVSSGGMFGGSAFTDTRIWSLRDVGIACLRWHATMSPPSPPPPVVDGGVGGGGTISVLTTLILATTHVILSEYDHQRDGGDGKLSSSSSSTPSTVFDRCPSPHARLCPFNY